MSGVSTALQYNPRTVMPGLLSWADTVAPMRNPIPRVERRVGACFLGQRFTRPPES